MERPSDMEFASLLDYLDGVLDDSAAAGVEARLLRDAAFRREYEALKELHGGLDALGRHIAAQTPAVNLGGEVMRRLDEVREDPRAEAMIAYIDGELDSAARRRLELELEHDPAMREELDGLRAMHQLLGEQGKDQTAPPRVDLVGEVMRRVAGEEGKAGFDALAEMFMEDELDAEGLRQARELAAASPERQRDWDAWNTLKQDLDALGEGVRGGAPRVDLKEAVMGAVQRPAYKPANVVTLPREAAPRKPRQRTENGLPAPVRWAGLAAAALLLVAAGVFLGTWNARTPDAPMLTEGLGEPDAQSPASVESTPRETDAAGPPRLDAPAGGEIHLVLPDVVSPPTEVARMEENAPETGASGEAEGESPFAGLSLEDVVLARRKALGSEDPEALGRLAEWSQLTSDEARALLALDSLSGAARVGAAQFLPPEEAAEVLREAARRDPDNAYLRYALAMNESTQGNLEGEGMEHLQSWSELDPANSMPYFLLARAQFSGGDNEGALSTLEQAAAGGQASAYGLQGARYQQQALEATGVRGDVAELLAATSAGSKVYEEVIDLAGELIQFGSFFESSQDYAAAEEIYSAVLDLGAQVSAGAVLANERLAGLDTQKSALTALDQLHGLYESPDAQAALREQHAQLLESGEDFAAFLVQYNALYDTSSVESIQKLASMVMQHGDLALLDLLSQ